ncbi:MAG: type II toxin-antitoxin system VapC family toxin [Pseudomonadota bacterium]
MFAFFRQENSKKHPPQSAECRIQDMGIAIKPLIFETIVKSHVVRLASGLMVNDSVIIASMKQEGVKLLATNDKAFEKVDEIHVCTPEDIKLS